MAAVTAEDLRGPRWDAVIDRILPAPTPRLPGHDTTLSLSLSRSFKYCIPFDLVSLVYSHALSCSGIPRSFPVCWRYTHPSPLTKFGTLSLYHSYLHHFLLLDFPIKISYTVLCSFSCAKCIVILFPLINHPNKTGRELKVVQLLTTLIICTNKCTKTVFSQFSLI